MQRGKIILNSPERFVGNHDISSQKIDRAINKALSKLEKNLEAYSKGFPSNFTPDKRENIYILGENDSWICGMHTGVLLLAYELSRDKKFLEAAKCHIPSYVDRFERKFNLQDHDVGFTYSPSIVSLYKITGDEKLRKLALDVTKYFYETGYSKEGGFIMLSQELVTQGNPIGFRTMMDTLLNIPLFFWAGEETGNKEYTDVAVAQLQTTEKYLIRADGSSYHHYQFDPETLSPVKGLTFQGYRDETTWSRGHSWGVLGFPVAYEFLRDKSLLELERDVVYYALNNLPQNSIPYWDYAFSDGSDEPRDTSAAVIYSAGLLEAIKYLDDGAPEKEIYKNAASMMLEAVIDNYTGEAPMEYSGLMWGVTAAKPFGMGIEDCGLYADYFYLESLMKYKNPGWKRIW